MPDDVWLGRPCTKEDREQAEWESMRDGQREDRMISEEEELDLEEELREIESDLKGVML